MQCNRTTPDQPTITCSICNESIHLGCLKVGCQVWRKEPPQYIGQLFNSPHFKFLCHSCVSKPFPIIQDDITVTMRSIEHKLDILSSSVVGATTDTNTGTTTSRQKPSFAETTAKAVVRQIEQSHRLPQQTTHPSPSPSGIANEVWRHIEKRQKRRPAKLMTTSVPSSYWARLSTNRRHASSEIVLTPLSFAISLRHLASTLCRYSGYIVSRNIRETNDLPC